jgi:hypothetical protein
MEWGWMWNVTAFDDASLTQMPDPPSTVGETKSKVGDGWPANLTGKVVTASWPDEKRFYIEEADRSGGILVNSPDTASVPAIGKLANVTGTMATANNGDRMINATLVSSGTNGTMPKTVGMNNTAVGGTNSGLICSVWGRVLANPYTGSAAIEPGTDATKPGYDPYGRMWMYVDDGSNADADYDLWWDDTLSQWINLGRFKGVKVYFRMGDYTPTPGDYVIVKGIAGTELTDANFTDGGGEIARVKTLETRTNVRNPESTGDWVDYGDFLVLPINP